MVENDSERRSIQCARDRAHREDVAKENEKLTGGKPTGATCQRAVNERASSATARGRCICVAGKGAARERQHLSVTSPRRTNFSVGGDRHAWTQVASTLSTVCHIKLHQAVSPVLCDVL